MYVVFIMQYCVDKRYPWSQLFLDLSQFTMRKSGWCICGITGISPKSHQNLQLHCEKYNAYFKSSDS